MPPVHTDRRAKDRDTWSAASLFAVAAVVLGHVLALAARERQESAIGWLGIAIGCLLLGLLVRRFDWMERRGESILAGALALGLAFTVGQLLHTLSALRPTQLYAWSHWTRTALAGCALALGAGMARTPATSRLHIPVLLACHFVVGAFFLSTWQGYTDVIVFHREALGALLDGENPYRITIPNIYGHTRFYDPALVLNGRVMSGYPYPPLSLLLAVPGHLLGDFRYSSLAATTLSGALLAYARPSRLATMATGLFLLTPTLYFVVAIGWTEPGVVLTVALMVFCACRAPKCLPWAVGLFIAAKQYNVLVTPLVLLLVPTRRPRELAVLFAKAAALALAITAPFVLWDVEAFWRSVVELHVRQPFRDDATSFLVLFSSDADPPWSGWGFVAGASATGVVWSRVARTPAGFATAVAVVMVLFFAFSKQAACNYYFFVIGLLCCALAVVAPPREQARITRRPHSTRRRGAAARSPG
jgi:hypothetical protein